MNSIRQIRELNKRELENGVSPEASWHTDYRDTAYIYIGGLPFELNEGDVNTIFSQYGEPVYTNLVRDKETGKSKGFAFLKYEDQRSTDLAVDNLGGSVVMGRTLKVDHTRYKKKDDEPDEGQVVVREEEESESEEERPMIREEQELAKLLREHDDDDPMKAFLVQDKREEVALALKRLEGGKGEKGERKHRHRHHHKSRSKREGSGERERKRGGDRERDRDGDRESRRSRPREERDRNGERDRRGDRERDRGDRDSRPSRLRRDDDRSRSPRRRD